MKEIWKPVKGYEGLYEASNTGKVRSVDRTIVKKGKAGSVVTNHLKGRELKPNIRDPKTLRSNITPRPQIVLSKNGKTKTVNVQNVIAEAFLNKENDKMTVNHIDGNELNNHISNLEYVSRADNTRHAFKNNLIKTQKPINQVDPLTNEIIKTYPGESEACRCMGVRQGKIGISIRNNWKCHGYKWEYATKERATTIEKWQGPTE